MPGENLRKTGSEMEEMAARFLSEHGVRILERNYRSREAEIDIIGEEKGTILFVEVKARRKDKKSGTAAESVGISKQKRICRCADYYMHTHRIDPFSTKLRFDVVAITWTDGDVPDQRSEKQPADGRSCLVRWIRNAFSYIAYSRVKPHWRVW